VCVCVCVCVGRFAPKLEPLFEENAYMRDNPVSVKYITGLLYTTEKALSSGLEKISAYAAVPREIVV
jgi:hypothetical protein